MLREIRLYGELGRRFGRVHRFAVDTVGEAVRALSANFKGFDQAMIESNGGYKLWTGTTRIGVVDDIHNPSSEREIIRISPVTVGAGKDGLTQAIVGAVVIYAAFQTGGATLTGGTLTTTAMGSMALNIGAGLILGGVAQMIAPNPSNEGGSGERPQNMPSYIFNGAINTTAQGHPVPVGYGRLIIGSAVISAGLTTEDIPT